MRGRRQPTAGVFLYVDGRRASDVGSRRCTENLMRVIRGKLKGRAPKLVDRDHGPKQAEVVDLMARLRASLEGKNPAGSSRTPAASKAKKHTRGRKRVA